MGTTNMRTPTMTYNELLTRLACASLTGIRSLGETERVAGPGGYKTVPQSSEKVAELALDDAIVLAELLREQFEDC